jgi:predicted Zn-dependent protease
MKPALSVLATALVAVLLLFPLSTAIAESELPELGDSTLAVVSPEQEYRLGRTWIRKLRGSTPTLNDPVLQDYLERQSYRLAFNSPLQHPDLTLLIINSKQINAFAVPGGVIGVNAGLLLHAETESEFSSVLAHELGHLSQRHFARRLDDNQRNQWLYLGTLLASIAVAASGEGQGAYALGASAQAALIQNQLSYSRQHEQEADRIGMQTLVSAGLDPHAMPTFFQRMERQSRQVGAVPEFVLTHPLTQSRIADTFNRANQFPKKLGVDSLDYQLARTRMLVQFMEDTGSTSAHYRQQLKNESTLNDRVRINRLGLTLSLLRERQFAQAREALAPLLADDPQRVDYIVAAVEIELADHRYQDAVALIDAARQLSPDNYPLLIQGARAYILNNEAAAIIEPLEAATRERSDDVHVWRLLMDAYHSTKNSLGVHRAKAEVLFLNGNEEKSLEQLKLAADETKGNYPLTAKIQKRMREIEQSKNDMKL